MKRYIRWARAEVVMFCATAALGWCLAYPAHAQRLEPNIYVPYEDLAHLIDPTDRAVLMDRAKFEALLAAAEANTRGADSIELGQVARADYSVEVSGDQLTLTGRLQVISMGKGAVAVPLGFAQMGLTRVALDDKPAPLGYDKQGKLTLIVTDKGTHQLDIEGAAKLKELSSGGMQFGMSLPAAVAGTMKLGAPGDLEIHATAPLASSSYDADADSTSAELALGGQDQLTVVLLGNGRRQDDRAILLGESATTVHLTRAHQTLGCLYTVQALRRGVRELHFLLPAEWTITDVTCPSLVRWSVETADGAQGPKTLAVRLRSDKVGTTALQIKASAGREGEKWLAPRVTLDGAAYQRGYLVVTTDEGLSVRGQELANARQEDVLAAASVPGIIAGPAARLYFHWGDNWSISLEPTVVELKRSIKEQQQVMVSADGVTLRGDFEVTAVKRELFDMSFLFEGTAEQWQIKTVLVDNQPTGFEYRVDRNADDPNSRRRLTIELPKPIRPEKLANVTIELQHVPSDWRWPSDAPAREISVPVIESDAQTVSGHVLISALDDLDALPRQVPGGLEAVPVGRMASLGIRKEVQYAYSYPSPAGGRMQLEVSRRRPRISGDAVGLLSVGPHQFSGHWRITYTVTRASTKRLFLLADKSLGQEININSANVPISAKSTVTPGPETLTLADELAQKYDLWSLDLDREATGEVIIEVNYERPKTSDSFSIPLVRPICGGQISEQLAIQASEELALTVDADQVREIDAIDLPPLPAEANRVLAAYRLEATSAESGSQPTIALKTAVHQNYDIPAALATSATLTTYLDPRGGQRTQAIFNVANAGRQFLTMRLPEGAQLWSLRVDDMQAKPQQNAQGDYQVGLGQLGKPVAVKIVYAYQPGKYDLERLRLGGVELPGVEMNQVNWTVVPPPNYRITGQDTKMQTSDLFKPAPAYTYLRWLLGRRIPILPHLGRASLDRTRQYAVNGRLGLAEGYSEADYDVSQEGAASVARYRSSGGSAAPPPTGRPAPQTQSAQKPEQERRPAAPPQQQFGSRLVQQGRFTLPVELVPTPGAGPQARFSGLGATELVLSLTSRAQQSSWWILGFLLVLAYGIMKIQRPARFKVRLVVFTLAAASLLAVWKPGLTSFTNGAFVAAAILLALYVLIWLIRFCWARLFPLTASGATAAVTAVLILLLGWSAQTAEAQSREPILQNEQNQQVQTDVGLSMPPAIVPYKGGPETAEESDKVLIPYARFVELWNQAHPDDPIDQPTPQTEISLSDVRYRAIVGQERLDLRLTANVKTYGRDWVVLGLPFSDLAVTKATLGGELAQLQVGPKGMVLMVPGQTSGRLELDAVAKCEYLGRSGSASFSVPPLPGAVMEVVLPQTDLELEVDQLEATPTKRLVNGSLEYTFGLGMTRRLALRWLPKVGSGLTDRTLSANSDHDVYAFHWAIVGVSRITYSFSSGDYSRFALLVPEGTMLTELTGTNVRDFRDIGARTVDGKAFRLIEVRLHRTAQKQYELTARWLSPHLRGAAESPDSTAEAGPMELALVRAGDVSRESGSVTLYSAGGMSVKVAQVNGGRRTDITGQNAPPDAELTADTARAVAKYYWPYRPFSLSVQMSRPTAAPKVQLDQLVRINTDQAELFVRANLKVDTDKLFGASFALPAGYELLSVVGPAVEDFYERSSGQGRFVHVKFHRGQIESLLTLALVRRNASLDSFEVPMVTYLDHTGQPLADQRGRLAVQVAASLEAQTAASGNLKSISPQTLKDWLDGGQISAAQFAYRYETSDRSLQLTIRSLPTTIRVEAFAGLVIRTTEAAYTYRLRYNIGGSPVDHLSFRLPSRYAPLVAVESEGMRSVVQSDPGDGLTEWTVALVNEVTGIVDVAVNFALPIDPATGTLEVVPLETDAPAGRRAIVAVQNMSRHDVNVTGSTNLSDLAVSEQRKLMSREITESLQYVLESFDDNWSLKLGITPAKTATRIHAVVDLLALTTVIDRSGRCRYEAKVELQNRSEQFLRIEMPRGLRLWSAKVASEPVKPAVAAGSPEGQVLIPLVKTSPGGLPYEVELYFADDSSRPLVRPLDGITRLKPPNISIVGIEVARTTWSLRLPGGYRYFRPGGNMSPAAGTVEMLSLGIDAKLEQLKRLEKSYREVAGSYGRKGAVAKQNWDAFNFKLGQEIAQAQTDLVNNRLQISQKDYERLNAKLGGQRQLQDALVGSNSDFIQRQETQIRNDLNAYLNTSISNAGVSEIARNQPLLTKPQFITESEEQQIARLQQELQVSQEQLNVLNTRTDGLDLTDQPVAKTPVQAKGKKLGDLLAESTDKNAEVSRQLEEITRQTAAQIDRKQAQIKAQIDELRDNRLQRHFREQAGAAGGAVVQYSDGMPPASPVPPTEQIVTNGEHGAALTGPVLYEIGGSRGGGLGGFAGTALPQPESQMRRQDQRSTSYFAPPAATPPAVTPGGPVLPAETPLYTASGTYSLPVTLPAGEIRLDFTRPSGEAKLSLWAIPNETLSDLYGAMVIVVGLLVIVGLIRIWPQSFAWRPLSARHIVGYILLLIVLPLLLGLLGVILSVLVIALIEARRGATVTRPAA